MHVDPVHDEFFKMQDLADALVRESIQNSLDARRSRASVRVRFCFRTGAQALHADAAQQYFSGLREHLQSSAPRADEPVPYLLIEDFGTRGLTGDPAVDPELSGDSETRNDFYYFWRNVGRSKKGDDDRGRWGLGKSVFTVASRIRTIFGLTLREDRRALLLGQCVLKTHILDGRRYNPYGFFATMRKKLPLPIEEPMLLDRFFDDFQLHRNEPGLSIVVPYYRADELSFERIIESVIRQYFYPLTCGMLSVSVEDGARQELVDAASIDDIARRFARDAGIDRLIALTRWSAGAARQQPHFIALTNEQTSAWSDDLLAPESVEAVRERFASGAPVAVQVPLYLRRKGSRTIATWFHVFLQRDEGLRRLETHFIRSGITIPDVKIPARVDKPVRALVIIEHESLSRYLGDAENPAHTDWSERADKLKSLYERHATPLRLVKHSAGFLASFLSRPPQGRVRDLLQDIFSIEQPGANAEASTPRVRVKKTEGESGAEEGARGAARTDAVTISPVAGGFTIRGTSATPGRTLTAQLAYRARVGNPFRKHSAFDFDLRRDAFVIDADAAEVERRTSNELAIVPRAARFHISVRGFDVRRDLVVRVLEQEDDAPETQLHRPDEARTLVVPRLAVARERRCARLRCRPDTSRHLAAVRRARLRRGLSPDVVHALRFRHGGKPRRSRRTQADRARDGASLSHQGRRCGDAPDSRGRG